MAKPRFFLNILLDDSTSIQNYIQHIVQGVNQLLDTIRPAQDRAVVVTIAYMKQGLLIESAPVIEVQPLSAEGYPIAGGTPLYDSADDLLARAEDLVANGGPDARAYTVLVSDGYDRRGKRITDPTVVAERVERMLRSRQHIVAALGIRNGYVDFFNVFRLMGIPREWIKVVEMHSDVQASISVHTARSVQHSLVSLSAFELERSSGWST